MEEQHKNLEAADHPASIARDFIYGSGEGDGGLLLPIARDGLDGERRSFMTPSRLGMHGIPVGHDHDERASRTTANSRASRSGVSDGGIPATEDSDSVDETNLHRHAVVQTSTVVNGFIDFIEACKKLEAYLGKFTHEVQKLGSALHLVKASRRLHQDLTAVRMYLEQNNQLNALLGVVKVTKSTKKAKRKKRLLASRAGSSLIGNYTEDLNGTLTKLADSLDNFAIAIVDFEDYTDEEGNSALEDFRIELRVLTGGLEFFVVDGESDHLHRFITARASSLKSNIDNLFDSLQRFEKIGIPCISFAQKRSTRMSLNAATVATFFAGVAATTLQYSVANTSSKREVAINTLWFASLVLSIGSAITGMLAMTWRLAVFSSPRRVLPWYIRFWIRSGYLALLIASVIAFLAGLVIYVFDSQPNKISFWIIAGLTAFCTIGLASVTFVFVKERWSFSQMREQMRKEFSPMRRFYESSGASWWFWLRYYLVDQLRKKRLRLFKRSSSVSGSAEHNKQGSFLQRCGDVIYRLPWLEKGLQRHATQDSEMAINGDAPVQNKRPHTWKRSSRQPASGRSMPKRTQSDPLQQTPVQYLGDPNFANWYSKQVKRLGLSLYAPVEQRALHLQFSPNGRWLVVCYKFECCVYNVEKSFEYHQTLRHNTRRKAKQVEWSPNGSRLLTRLSNDVKIWTIDEHDNFIFDKAARLRDVDVTDIQWLDDDEFLAIANELTFFRVNVAAEETERSEYNIEWDNELLELYYLYTMPESELVVIVGARKIEGLPEDKAIDCIIVYKMDVNVEETRTQSSHSTRSSTSTVYAPGSIVQRIPLLSDMESLSFGSRLDGTHEGLRYMLVGYLSKPPEIWTMDVNTGRASLESQLEREPGGKQDPEAEWGDVFFTGPTESIIACAEDGIMHFWDLDTRKHFHKLEIVAGEDVEELPVVTWIPHSPAPMMATAGKGLPLNIWAPMKERMKDEEKNETANGPDGHAPQRIFSGDHQLQISTAPPTQYPTGLPYPQSTAAPLSIPDLRSYALGNSRAPSPRIYEEVVYANSPEASIKGDESKEDEKIEEKS
ncbi:hypothetical protein M0805_007940 [Coniferiporia weirii]|nr:hypothetical protein M0805_007940 [Coniferiporia weirii]